MRVRRTRILAAGASVALVAATLPIAASGVTAADPATDLLFSEYVEGSGNNKAIEIYNGTGADVDLGSYTVELYSNGGTAPSQTQPLAGVLADSDVFVIANASADPAVLAVADITAAVTFYNGDDALVLRNGGAVVDSFGQVGVDPGSEWPGGGQEDTLRRLPSICTGDTDETDAFDAGTEWSSFAQNTFDGLGSHTSDCGTTSEPASPVINEFSASTTGADLEYVEILGDPVTDYSGLTVIEIEGDGSSAVGTIDEVIAVGTTDASGFYLAPLASNALENGSLTLLLLDGFTGAVGDDLDTNNDGTFDVTPWASIVDGVSVQDSDGVSFSVALGENYDGVSPFAPGGASRIPDGTDTDTSADWVRNDFDLAGIPGFTGTPIGGEALNTPGASNAAVEVEPPSPCESTTPIADVQGPGDATPLAGVEVAISGIVTADFGGEIFVQESPTAPRSGVLVFSSGNAASVGDEVCVTGVASERFGQTQVGGNGSPSATVDVLTSGNAVPAPAVVATGSAGDEQWEGVLIRTENVEIVDPDLGFGEYSIDDGSGIVVVDDLGFSFVGTAGQSLDFVQGPLYYSFGDYKIQPRDADDIGIAVVIEVCGDPATFIHDIQGSGATSPLDGQTVSIEGVVVGDFQDDVGANGDLNGFYVQEEDADADANALTSEGIFVFQGSDPDIDVAVGDVVRVRGMVGEFNGSTQLSADTVLSCGPGSLPTAATVTLPVASVTDLEAFEGMSVEFPQSLAIVEFFNFDRFGEMVLATDRQFQPTAIHEPGSAESAALADLNSRSRITLDDGRTASNPDPARHPNGADFTLDNRFRGGDLVTNASGVLDYSFGLYRIQPTAGADYTAVNERPAAPEPVGGNVQVASFNVLNYFNTLDGAGPICGPANDQGCRGADNENERVRQLDKIVAAMADLDADVLGIIEVENTVDVEAMTDIVDGLNAQLGAGTYDYIDTGLVGDDVIKVGFIYQPASVTPLGDFAVLDDPAFVAPFGEDKNRAALAQTFRENATGGVFTATVNHLKSKGSGCGAGDDDPEAGSCNLTRTVAAQVLADWLATDPTGSGDPDMLIVGDLNSYDQEDPIDALKAAGYADLLGIYQGEFAYSFVFSGALGYLDYAMANASLASQVTGTAVWSINADEPDILDYDTSFKKDAQDALYEPNAYRSSDHDPVIVGLDVCDSIAPTIEVMLSPDALLVPNHKYVEVSATVIAADNFDSAPTVTLVSVTSDEPDNGPDDGNTVDDIVIVDDETFLLRAERSGIGDGRTYTVTYEVQDSCGNTTIGTATVEVPLSRSNTQPQIR